MSWYDNGENKLAELVGKTVKTLRFDEEYLIFELTDGELLAFDVEGDCCSHSYFHDFHGVEHLLAGNPITQVDVLEVEDEGEQDWEVIQTYGFRITTEHPTFGPVSSVWSFRNASNGYYGGWMNYVSNLSDETLQSVPVITEAVVEAQEHKRG